MENGADAWRRILYSFSSSVEGIGYLVAPLPPNYLVLYRRGSDSISLKSSSADIMKHSVLVLEEWDHLVRIADQDAEQEIVVDGRSLSLAGVVAVARYHPHSFHDPSFLTPGFRLVFT